MQTILDLAGLPVRPALHRDGMSLAPALANPSIARPRTLLWHFPHDHSSGWIPGSAIRSGDWKLIHYYESGAIGLFNLATDPSERDNLADSHPEQRTLLQQGLATQLRAMNGEPVNSRCRILIACTISR